MQLWNGIRFYVPIWNDFLEMLFINEQNAKKYSMLNFIYKIRGNLKKYMQLLLSPKGTQEAQTRKQWSWLPTRGWGDWVKGTGNSDKSFTLESMLIFYIFQKYISVKNREILKLKANWNTWTWLHFKCISNEHHSHTKERVGGKVKGRKDQPK